MKSKQDVVIVLIGQNIPNVLWNTGIYVMISLPHDPWVFESFFWKSMAVYRPIRKGLVAYAYLALHVYTAHFIAVNMQSHMYAITQIWKFSWSEGWVYFAFVCTYYS